MVAVAVFHHAHGLTAGVRRFAHRLRGDGHDVAVPDLYDGATFDALPDGVAHAERIGFGTIIDRGRAAVAGQPGNRVRSASPGRTRCPPGRP